jgi:outer membrane lipopolysaccharide assembly protein LptE/RlpB
MWWFKRTIYSLGLALILLGCGYRLEGTTVSSLPSHIKRVHIPIFQNGTTEEGVEVRISEELRNLILEDGRLELAQGRTDAQAIIIGEVREFILRPISFNNDDRIREYRLRISVRATLRDLEDNEILFDQTIRADREYGVSENLGSNEQAQREAIDRGADDFARELKSLIIEGF